MSVRNIDCFFHPKGIALIGVTTNPNSVGGQVLINLVTGGFQGVVYPINADSEKTPGGIRSAGGLCSGTSWGLELVRLRRACALKRRAVPSDLRSLRMTRDHRWRDCDCLHP